MMIQVSGSFHFVALPFLTCDSKVIWIKEERTWEITREKLPFIYSFSTGYSLVIQFHLIAKEAEKMSSSSVCRKKRKWVWYSAVGLCRISAVCESITGMECLVLLNTVLKVI